MADEEEVISQARGKDSTLVQGGQKVYPRTFVHNVYDEDGSTHLGTILNTLRGAHQSLAHDIEVNHEGIVQIRSELDTATTGIYDRLDTAEDDIDALEAELNTAETGLKARMTAAEADIDAIEALIPNAASSSNKLVDKAAMDEAIESLAASYVTSDANGNAFATKAALTSGTCYRDGVVYTPNKNDYAIVLADEDKASEGVPAPTTRYIYTGSRWAFQYVVHNTPLTQAQLNAMNSGIDSTLVAKIGTNESNISDLQTNVGGLDTRLTAAEGDIDAVEGRMTSAEGDIDAVEGRMATAEGNITSLGNRVTTNENDISLLKSTTAAVANRMTSAEGRLTTAEGDIDSLESRMATAESDIDAVEGRMTTAENDIDTLQTTVAQNTSDISSNTQQITDIIDILAGDGSSNTGLVGRLEASEAAIGRISAIEDTLNGTGEEPNHEKGIIERVEDLENGAQLALTEGEHITIDTENSNTIDVIVDDELDDSSTHPVQNAVVKAALDDKIECSDDVDLDTDIDYQTLTSRVAALEAAIVELQASRITNVATEAEMNALLVEANVGRVYRFIGTTTAKYTQGELYQVEIGD